MSSTLQCTIRPKEGGEIQRTAEISGEGKSYLACLSENLSAMQVEVNSLLTEMVEKEKAESSSKNGTRSEGDSGSEGWWNGYLPCAGIPTLYDFGKEFLLNESISITGSSRKNGTSKITLAQSLG